MSCEKEALTFRASGLYKGSVKGPLKAPLQDPIGLGDLVWEPFLLLFGVYNGTQNKKSKREVLGNLALEEAGFTALKPSKPEQIEPQHLTVRVLSVMGLGCRAFRV